MKVLALRDFKSYYLDGNTPSYFKDGETYTDPAPPDAVRRWQNAGWVRVLPEQKAKPAAPENKDKGQAPENKTRRKRKKK